MEINLPIEQGVTVSIDKNIVRVEASGVTLERKFPNQVIAITVGQEISIKTKITNAKTKALVGTFRAHIKNMMKGVKEKFVYKLKVCSVHFPMNIDISGQEVIINNFLGSKQPLKVRLKQGVDVKLEGDIITIEAHDKELAGETATKLEQSTRLNNKDRRVFQDGIFVTEKAGKVIE